MRQLWTSLSEETRVPGPLPKSDKAAPRVEFSKQSLRWFQSTLLDRNDWLVVTFFAVTVAVGCLSIAGTLPPSIFQTMEYWFEADTLREVSNTTRVHNDHYRMSVHPLFSLFTLVPVYVLKHGLAIGPLQAVLLMTSLIGGLWAGVLYILLRLLGCRKRDGEWQSLRR